MKQVVAALILRENTILICQRKEDQAMPLKWEFPGGKVERDEDLKDALHRELEEELDKNIFYRANRKYIINTNYIKRFKPLERSKISVELTLPVNEEIIISQENSASFKKWIAQS